MAPKAAGFSFGNLGSLDAKPKKASSKKSDRPEIETPNVYDLAALDEVINALTAVRKDKEVEIKDAAREAFIAGGCISKIRPENYLGTENGASASIELRRKTSSAKLALEDIEQCVEWGIETTEVVEVIPTFAVNPIYLNDAKIIGALEQIIGAAIAAKKVPVDIIQRQEKVSHFVVHERVLETLWAKGTNVVTAAWNMCCTLAVGKSKFPGTLEDAVDVVGKLVPELAKPVAKATRAKA